MVKEKINLLRLSTMFLLILLMINVNGRGIKKVVKQPQKETVAQIKLTPFNVYNKIVEYEFDHPKIVFSQVMLETGNLKRIKNNNLFGFRYKSYLKFDTWEDCIKYAKKWQDKKYIKGDYYSFLKRIGYAEDSLYISKIKRMEILIFKTNLYGLE